MKKIILFLSAFLFIINTCLFTQDLNEICFHGYVTDMSNGKGVANVMVEVINEADPAQKCSGKTDITGRYVLNLATAVKSVPQDHKPAEFKLEQNYPNPFNPSTLINFQIPRAEHIQLVVYNTLGQKIKTLVDGRYAQGHYTVAWDATDGNGNGVAAGIYFYQLRAGDYMQTRKMTLIDGYGAGHASFHYKTQIQKQENHNNTLNKPNTMTVTIRATGQRINIFEKKHITISSNDVNFDIHVVQKETSLFNEELIHISDPGDSGQVYVSGLAGTVIDTTCGLDNITVLNNNTGKMTSAQVYYDGSFPLLELEAATGDCLTVQMSTYMGEFIQSSFNIVDNVPPKITSSAPTNGDKDIIIDSIIIIRFTEPINSVTVNVNSFTLFNAAGYVSGSIGFIEDNTCITFTPDQPLDPNTVYTIKLTTEIADINGNHLENPFLATFTTGPEYAGLETQWIKHEINCYCWDNYYDFKLVMWDNDENPDIVFRAGLEQNNQRSSYLSYFIASDWFEVFSWYPAPPVFPRSDIEVADMDKDDDLDVVMTGYAEWAVIWVERYDYEAFGIVFPDWRGVHYIDYKKNITNPYDLCVADMNADRDPDVVVTGHDNDMLVWYEYPDWTIHIIDDSLAGAANMGVTDFDGDIDIDVVATGMEANAVIWYKAPYWDKIYIDDNLNGAEYVNIVDLNADGKLDVLATGVGEVDVVWYEAPSWTKHVISNNLEYACDVKAADMNDDMMLDVVATDSTSHFVVWFKAPDWSMHIVDNELHNAHRVEIIDLDGDSDMDIVATGANDAEMVWYEQITVK
ncbi:Ig-like domain-containing protein [candidate division KSB1 bacterium]|nr:Ig-like domain-containing protein [candidate division KSB1 bacterium]